MLIYITLRYITLHDITGGMSQPGSARTTGDSVPGSGVQFGSGTPRSSSRVPATGDHSSAVILVLANTSSVWQGEHPARQEAPSNPKTSVLVHKCQPYAGNLNTQAPGDSKMRVYTVKMFEHTPNQQLFDEKSVEY